MRVEAAGGWDFCGAGIGEERALPEAPAAGEVMPPGVVNQFWSLLPDALELSGRPQIDGGRG
jgi:hypothetical protein